jgi:glycerate 2-kinase
MSLREDAIAIWRAGVTAVESARLTQQQIRVRGNQLYIAGHDFDIPRLRRIEVVGAGKAGAGMAAGIERALATLPNTVQRSGFVNVPADCLRPLSWIRLHVARPAGLNQPTLAAVDGTAEILSRVSTLTRDDICLVVLSGGGSALLCAPVADITLEDKIEVTRILAEDGAPIDDLNCVRTQLSVVKGGGLARRSMAGHLIALIISDVIGDPLDVIASGPTVQTSSTRRDALAVFRRRGISLQRLPIRVRQFLESPEHIVSQKTTASCSEVVNHIIGNNQTALNSAAAEAVRRGYDVHSMGSQNQREASEEGRLIFRRLQSLRENRETPAPICLLSGGEPTVKLSAYSQPRKGGRNQELVLAAIEANRAAADWSNCLLLSGGTDGEDGPTDAAGAIADQSLVRQMNADGIDPASFLRINNSYPYFDRLGGLLRTGPTHTNVMDLRVGLAGPGNHLHENDSE